MDITAVLTDPAQLRALTTLTPDEFERLRVPFARAVRRRRKMYTIAGKRRRRPASPRRLARRTKALPDDRYRLLFVLVALKTDATQHHLALTFGIKQKTASEWYRFLLPALDVALRRLGCRPARTLAGLAGALRSRGDGDDRGARGGDGDHGGTPPSLHMDATARRIPRNGDRDAQRADYSGKHRHHAAKNTVICDAGQRVVYLGPTWRGARHDKRMADEELPGFGALAGLDAWLTLDAGYTGYVPAHVHALAAQRARRGHPLAPWQKAMNRWVASVRVVVEHAIGAVKRLAKAARVRTADLGHADLAMQVACGLHNFRVASRPETYARSRARTNARLRPF